MSRPVPRLGPGVELIGEMRGSGSFDVPWLIRRGDGRALAVSALLFQIAAEVDGRSDAATIARRVSARAGRPVGASDVGWLLDNKLRPLGVVAGDRAGAEASPGPGSGPTSGPAGRRRLRLRALFKVGVVPVAAVDRVATGLSPLFHPAAVAAFLGALVGVDLWLLLGSTPLPGAATVVGDPWSASLVLALTLAAGAFHEAGHAAGARYGGASPGRVGVGFYLVWPVFFSDLNDSYRLDRTGRLRADLGGVYFNVVFIVALAGAYALTGAAVLLVVIVLHHVLAARQFLPFVRLDGYYIVSDLAGVPDLFGRIGPVLTSLLPGRSAALDDLRPAARRLVTAWAIATVTALAVLLLLAVRRLV